MAREMTEPVIEILQATTRRRDQRMQVSGVVNACAAIARLRGVPACFGQPINKGVRLISKDRLPQEFNPVDQRFLSNRVYRTLTDNF